MIKKANTAVSCLDLVNYFLHLKPASFKRYRNASSKYNIECIIQYNLYSHDVSKTGEQQPHY